MYNYYMSTSGFKLAPYSLEYNTPKRTLEERLGYFVIPYRFIVVLIPNKL